MQSCSILQPTGAFAHEIQGKKKKKEKKNFCSATFLCSLNGALIEEVQAALHC